MVETKRDLKLKCLRFANGGEYIDGGLRSIVQCIWHQNGENYYRDSTTKWCG